MPLVLNAHIGVPRSKAVIAIRDVGQSCATNYELAPLRHMIPPFGSIRHLAASAIAFYQ
jgi:hypothetical protein